MVPRLDLPFTGGEGASLSFDFYRPATDAVLPVVVCIHGGGWISGDKSMMAEVAVNLADQGYAVACPEYRLAPLHPYPCAVEDVQAFVRHLRAHAAELNIDPNAVASLGNSAGGHLSSMLGLLDGEVDGIRSKVNAVVNICGIADLTRPAEQHFPVSFGFLEQFMGVPYNGHEATWAEASPVSHVDKSDAPFLIIHGEEDDIVPIAQSEVLAAKLFTTGCDVEFHRLPGEGHSFTFEGWSQIEALFYAFLARTLRGEVPA